MAFSVTKKILLLLCLTALVCGCTKRASTQSQWYKDNGKIKILTTISMIGDLVEQIGADEIDCIALICGDLDPHSYELVKGDDEKFARADIIFYNGLGLEHSLSLKRNLEGNRKAVAVAEPLLARHEELVLKKNNNYDPHVWMDISLWKQTVDPIVEALCAYAPEHATKFKERAELVKQKMDEMDATIYTTMQSIDESRRYLVTSHDAFQYFTRRYLAKPGEEQWQKRCKAPEGLAPEAQMSVSDVLKVLAHIEAYHISVLFPESNMSKDSLKKILDGGKQKGLDIRLCREELYGDSMGDSLSYLDMIAHNASIIAHELANER